MHCTKENASNDEFCLLFFFASIIYLFAAFFFFHSLNFRLFVCFRFRLFCFSIWHLLRHVRVHRIAIQFSSLSLFSPSSVVALPSSSELCLTRRQNAIYNKIAFNEWFKSQVSIKPYTCFVQLTSFVNNVHRHSLAYQPFGVNYNIEIVKSIWRKMKIFCFNKIVTSKFTRNEVKLPSIFAIAVTHQFRFEDSFAFYLFIFIHATASLASVGIDIIVQRMFSWYSSARRSIHVAMQNCIFTSVV